MIIIITINIDSSANYFAVTLQQIEKKKKKEDIYEMCNSLWIGALAPETCQAPKWKSVAQCVDIFYLLSSITSTY